MSPFPSEEQDDTTIKSHSTAPNNTIVFLRQIMPDEVAKTKISGTKI
jgi:hypothetical protein